MGHMVRRLTYRDESRLTDEPTRVDWGSSVARCAYPICKVRASFAIKTEPSIDASATRRRIADTPHKECR